MTSYGLAIHEAFTYLLKKYPEVFVIGQGLWSPWYVGNTMTDLDVTFGKDRVLDSPVSENACTGAAIGAALCGYRPVVVHPRMDFMVLATDAIVNQAAKWGHMLGGQARPAVTIRGIVNRGGEQGAQHSQALHSWYAHIPGLRVVMPSTPQDARDLLIASVLSPDPVVFIDDRWLYDLQDELPPVKELDLADVRPLVTQTGEDVTLVGSSFASYQCRQAATELRKENIKAEVIDLRTVNPLNLDTVIESVRKTGRLIAVDGSWENCGLAGEVVAGVMERVPLKYLKASPRRITLPHAPAPTSKSLEQNYYPTVRTIMKDAHLLCSDRARVSSEQKIVVNILE